MVFAKTPIPLTFLLTLLIMSTVCQILQTSSTKPATTPPKTVAAAASCLARSTIIARAQDWVTKKVPYNQEGRHDGYRTDCSGFVSMAWKLAKPGLLTGDMPTVAKNITKNELKPGDAINCDTTHIVIFAGWTNSSKTHYTAMYEANPSKGTVKRVTPYPFFDHVKCYHPIRYNKVC